ncbi:MAG: CvpA family protein [Rickettsiales bacterium]
MDISEFRNLDYIVLVIILISAYFGSKKGFIESFLDFFAWVGSAFIVMDNYNLIFDFINDYIPSKFISACVASIGMYVLLVVLISMLGTRVLKFTSTFVGSPLDKFIGFIFGAARGIFVALLLFWSLYMVVYAVNDQKFPEWMIKAQLYKPLKMGADGVVDLISSEDERKNLMQMIAKKSNKLEAEVNSDTKKQNAEIKDSIEDSEIMD